MPKITQEGKDRLTFTISECSDKLKKDGLVSRVCFCAGSGTATHFAPEENRGAFTTATFQPFLAHFENGSIANQ
jgi:hypothetical protein